MADPLASALAEAGGMRAPTTARAQLAHLLAERLERDAAELDATRSGTRELPVTVALAAVAGGLLGVCPVDAAARADPARAGQRGWTVVAALVGALVEAGDASPGGELALAAGEYEGRWLALRVPAREPDPELAAVAFDAAVEDVDRLRASALALPAHVLAPVADLRAPLNPALRVAEAVARLGGNPTDPAAAEELEDALAPFVGGAAQARPHEDPAPERRIARRILQRLAGMGKWGGYHTDFRHLARGFEGNERRLALEIGERLLAAGLLDEKQSVGQRHVFLNSRRAADIYALIDEGRLPRGLELG